MTNEVFVFHEVRTARSHSEHFGTGVAPTSAVAATVTTTFGVSATVQATCLVSAAALAFGTYTGVVANSTSAVSVTCTNTTPYNVGLSAGLGRPGIPLPRFPISATVVANLHGLR